MPTFKFMVPVMNTAMLPLAFTVTDDNCIIVTSVHVVAIVA